MAASSKTEPDSGNAYLYNLWRSTDFGNSWTVSTGLPRNGFLYGLSRHAWAGRHWLTRNGYLWTSTNDGVSWDSLSSADLPATGGLYVTAASVGVVMVGGTHGLYRSSGSPYTTWTHVGGGGFDFRDDSLGEVGSALHKVRWHGIQQILFDPLVANRVWVVSYYRHSGTPTPGNRIGIWKSNDNGLTFSQISNARLRRGVAVDSLGPSLPTCVRHRPPGSLV